MDPAARRRIRELAEWIRSAVPAGEDVLDTVTRELAPMLGTDQIFAYGLDTGGEKLRLAFLKSSLTGISRFRDGLASLVERQPASFAHYDPRAPPPAQRNVAITLGDLRRATGVADSPMLRLVEAHGFSTRDQLRVLVCDGPELLALVGALRERPFRREERDALQALVRPLRDRLALERRLDRVPWAFAALGAALDQLGAAAVVVRRPLRILHCNAPAAALMARDGAGFTAGLREELDGRGDGRWLVTPLRLGGGPGHFLALRRRPPRDASAPAVAAGARYGLTRRQVAVLEGVARGEANKTIASALACSESAVEQHVTRLLRCYGVETRARLVARFWTDIR